MGRVSIPTGSLVVLGALLIILGGYSPGQDMTPAWVGNLQYFLFIVGVILVLAAVVLMLRKR